MSGLLSDNERLDWLQLIRSENIGPITFYRLLERFGTAKAALEALPDLARRGGRAAKLVIASRSAAERELIVTNKHGARLIAHCEPDYPAMLARLDDAPPLLCVKGNLKLSQRRTIAIVGARNASLNGRRYTERLAGQLGHAGLTVVSGLARGIDTAAHTGSLATGTIAVLAGGVDVVYPPENEDLHTHIAEQGLLVAEEPIGTEPQARHFPKRNRLISGLSMGVLVVEAALRSGSLITARTALEQGRDVFAVPGSPLDPRCQGTNNLLREGAILTETIDDILGALATQPYESLEEGRRPPYSPALAAAPDEAAVQRAHPIILECLSHSPVPVDELIRDCQLSASVVLTVLLELELAGRVQRQPGGLVNLL